MVDTRTQYETYPYPARDPADETRRLVTGSPSLPAEIDHFLFAGQRDWSRPLRVLVAGGGTGDGLIQLAQGLTDAAAPYEITYLDLSTAARRIAEERAKVRKLRGITFLTGSLLDAPDLGRFDYIDCCGVLHHLPDPAAGFAALRAALADDGGLGFMVYAPLGRSGVYPLQEAFGALFDGWTAEARLAEAKKILARLPAGHPFKVNPHVGDHHASDAGFYDLLLHGQDRAFDVAALLGTLDATGWELSGFCTPALYDLARLAPVPDDMDEATRMAVAEKLRGTMKVHVGYAVPAGSGRRPATARNRALVPHLRGVDAARLAQAVARDRPIPMRQGGIDYPVHLPPGTAPLVAAIDGRRSLTRIAAAAGVDPLRFGTLWAAVERELTGWGVLLYSSLKGEAR